MLQRWSRIRRATAATPAPHTVEMIARNAALSVDEVEECLEAIRLTRPEEWHDDVLAPSIIRRIDPAEGLQTNEDQKLMADAIESLPRQERLVVSMYYLDDLRLKEVGEVLGLSESRVSRILGRAQLRMREYVNRRS
jgi:RNA polymerase sigma factor for flagellar operon FliA